MSIISPQKQSDDLEIEQTLRPKLLDDFTGQEKLKTNLFYAIQSAKHRGENIDHILFYGPPGLGKTTLAEIVANEMGVDFKQSSGPVLLKAGDIVGLLTTLQHKDVLFIDEIHRLNRNIEEYLYPAMEDFQVDIMIDSGPSARSVQLNLENFTLIGATTMAGSISKPMRDRFGIALRLEFYTETELATIIKRASNILNINIEDSAALQLGKRARGTPRIANRLLRRCRDVAIVDQKSSINNKIVNKTLSMLGIDEDGLDELDIKILDVIIDYYNGGPVGLKSIATVIGEDEATLEEMYEPYLIQKGYIKRSPRGRVATQLAYSKLNKLPNNNNDYPTLF